MTSGGRNRWRGEVRLAIGKALLAHPAGLTAKQLAEATGRDPSNLRKVAETMIEAELVGRCPPRTSGTVRGRQPTAAYALAGDAEGELRAALRDHLESGQLRPSQQIVWVEAGEKFDTLMNVLAEEETAARGAWAAISDGARQEMMIAFDGSDAVDASLDLMAIFSAAGLQASRSNLSLVEGIADLIKSAQRRHDLASRGAARRRARSHDKDER
jgi:hypothetical protein